MKPGSKWFSLLFCALGLLQCGPGDRLAGGSEIGNPVGVVMDENGNRLPGVVLRLLPKDFNPVSSDPREDSLQAISGPDGRFRFSGTPGGNYVLTGWDPATGLRVMARLSVTRANADAGTLFMKRTGTVTANISDTSLHSEGGHLYLPGTLLSSRVDVVGRIRLDSVPAGNWTLRYTPPPLLPLMKQPEFQSLELPPGIEAEALSVGSAPQTFRALYISAGQDLQSTADSLRPGDTLYLRGGIHALSNLTLSAQGRPDAWIQVRNAPGETPVLRGISSASNLIDIVGAAYLEIRGLEIDSTPEGCDAIKFGQQGVSHHISLRGLHIHNVGGMGINSQGNHHHVVVQGNHIHHVRGDQGTGIRLGDLSGNFMPRLWELDNNWIHHCGFDANGGVGISALLGAMGITIRDNVVHDNNTLGIRVFGANGTVNAADFSLVEGNAVWNSLEGIAAYSDATVRNNIVFACSTLLHSFRYTGDGQSPAGNAPRNLAIYQNTFFGGGDIVLSNWDSSRTCVFANNAVLGTSGGLSLSGTGTLVGNVSDFSFPGFSSGTPGDFRDASMRSFYPGGGSTLVGKAVRPFVHSVDFMDRPRDGFPDVGAYEYHGEGEAPFPIAEDFKH